MKIFGDWEEVYGKDVKAVHHAAYAAHRHACGAEIFLLLFVQQRNGMEQKQPNWVWRLRVSDGGTEIDRTYLYDPDASPPETPYRWATDYLVKKGQV